MRRVLFLDLDGVANSVDYTTETDIEREAARHVGAMADPALLLDPTRIARVNAIVEGLDVDVVLSSAWRQAFSIDAIRSFLVRRGFTGRLVDFTPLIGLRHKEIAAWLAVHPVDRFVIVDDMQSAGDTMEENFVEVADGLEDEHVERARRVLA